MEMRVSRLAKAESKLEISKPIHNVEIEGGIASTSCPHLGDFLQAAEDEGLLGPAECCCLGFVSNHLDDYLGGLKIAGHFHLKQPVSNMADKISCCKRLSSCSAMFH